MDPKQFLARVKALTSALTPTQVTTLAIAFFAVVLLVGGSAYWLNSSSYHLLFADLDAESAADVVSRLKAQKVPYQLDQGGRAVRVPADRIDELRLEFAGQGMPSSGRIGFEIFDRTAFGATEFLEHVNYRRALEGEIARTIATLAEVGSARVHIAMAKESLFGEREQPAKASVVLKLKHSSRPLAASTVNGIASLVAASVEGLRPESVVIMDSYGRPLLRPSDAENARVEGLQLERQQRLERDLATRVVSLIEPVVGIGHVRANVTVRLNPQSQEETEERWDPASPVIRSRQTSSDGTTGSPVGVGGLAGSRANLPPPATVAAPTPAASANSTPAAAGSETANSQASAPGAPAAVTPPAPAPVSGATLASASLATSRSTETTNFEISKVVRHTVRPQGDIARLSVAVLIDNAQVAKAGANGTSARTSQPRTAEEMQKIQGIVAAAVGLDPARGDQLTVENIPFDESLGEEPQPPGVWQRYGPQVLEIARILAVVLLGLAAIFFVIRPMVRRGLGAARTAVTAVEPVLPQQLPRTVGDLQGELAAQLQAGTAKGTEPQKLAALTKRLAAMTQKEPETAARAIRTWLAEEEGN